MTDSTPQNTLTIVDKNLSIIDSAYPLERSQNLLKNLLINRITTFSKCGGKAICGGCRVKITAGHRYCNKPVAEEKVHMTEQQLEQGWRLACQVFCLRDINVYLPTIEEIKNLT